MCYCVGALFFFFRCLQAKQTRVLDRNLFCRRICSHSVYVDGIGKLFNARLGTCRSVCR